MLLNFGGLHGRPLLAHVRALACSRPAPSSAEPRQPAFRRSDTMRSSRSATPWRRANEALRTKPEATRNGETLAQEKSALERKELRSSQSLTQQTRGGAGSEAARARGRGRSCRRLRRPRQEPQKGAEGGGQIEVTQLRDGLPRERVPGHPVRLRLRVARQERHGGARRSRPSSGNRQDLVIGHWTPSRSVPTLSKQYPSIGAGRAVRRGRPLFANSGSDKRKCAPSRWPTPARSRPQDRGRTGQNRRIEIRLRPARRGLGSPGAAGAQRLLIVGTLAYEPLFGAVFGDRLRTASVSARGEHG